MTTSELANPPSDGISAVKFSPIDPFLLACSSWDRSVKVYNIKSNTQTHTYKLAAPLLDATFSLNGANLYTGGLDKGVSAIDLATSTVQLLGKHNDGVRCLVGGDHTIFSGSWDRTVKVWDPRSNGASGTIEQPDKVTFDLLGFCHGLVRK
jgi:cell cycle arrest protein BUB3